MGWGWGWGWGKMLLLTHGVNNIKIEVIRTVEDLNE
jgi:hypothetical protein